MARRRPVLKVVQPMTLAPDTVRELGNTADRIRACVRILEEPNLFEHVHIRGERDPGQVEDDVSRYTLAVVTLTATSKRLYELVGQEWSE